MKQKILEALKAKFLGVSETILNRYADKLAKTVTTEEAVTTAVEGVTIQNLIDSYADSRATEATQTAVVNYEKKHSLKEGKPVQPQQPQEVELPDDTPAWAKAIITQNKTLSDKIAKIESGNTVNSRKDVLKKRITIEGVPESVINKALKDFERMNIENDEDFEAFATETETTFKELAQQHTDLNLSAFPRPGGSIPGGEPKKEAVVQDIKEWSEKNAPAKTN